MYPLGRRLVLGTPAVAVLLIESSVSQLTARVPVTGERRRRRDLPVPDVTSRQTQSTTQPTLYTRTRNTLLRGQG